MADDILMLLAGQGAIMVRPWRDDDASRPVVHPLEDYVYWCWTAVLGTLCVAVGQRLALWAENEGVEVDLRELAVTVGHPGSQTALHSSMVCIIARLARYGLVQVQALADIRIRTAWPLLGRRLAQRLPILL